MDAHLRIKRLLDERGWTEYRLSKECGLSQSTIGNIMRRNTVPSIATLESICHGLGISMAQFFAENDMIEVTSDVKELLNCWMILTPMQKDASLYMMKAMLNNELGIKNQETM